MSRTGKRPIQIPAKVKVSVHGSEIVAEGPLGKETVMLNALANVDIQDKQIAITRVNDSKEARCVHGMMRALLANAVTGVSEGFSKRLDINGVGYRVEIKGKSLKLNLGFSHPVDLPIPEGIKIEAPDQTKMLIKGSNKEQVGRLASQIRSIRPPEPYKGKGIKYANETIIRKVGKAAGGK